MHDWCTTVDQWIVIRHQHKVCAVVVTINSWRCLFAPELVPAWLVCRILRILPALDCHVANLATFMLHFPMNLPFAFPLVFLL